MSWSYSGDPSSNPKDAVRFLIGDTDKNDPLLLDGEISYLLAKYNNAPPNAAIHCCEAIMVKFARLSDENVGRVGLKFSQKVKQYGEMRETLRMRLAMTDASPVAPSLSKAAKDANNANADAVKPSFTVHEMENHQTASQMPQSSNVDAAFDQGGNN